MAKIDRLVNVQIELGTTAISGQSFSDLLILGKHSVTTGRVMVVTDAAELLDMGIGSTDPLYLAASAAFSQGSHISQVYIGKIRAYNYVVSVPGTANKTHKINLSWIDSNGEAQAGVVTKNYETSNSNTATNLVTAVTALKAPVSVTSSGGSLTITPNDGADVAITVSSDLTLTANYKESVTDALAACVQENNGWYGLAITSRTEADVLLAAAFAEANNKLGAVLDN